MIDSDTALTRCEDLIAMARRMGADAADAVMRADASEGVEVRLGKLEEVERSESESIGLRVFVGRRSASIHTSDFTPDAFRTLAERALAMARIAPEDPYSGLAPSERLFTGALPDLDLFDAHETAPETLRERAFEAEDAARAIAGVTNSNGGGASRSHSVVALVTYPGPESGPGFARGYQASGHAISASVVAGEGGRMQTDSHFRSARHAADLPDPAAIGAEAGRRAVARLDPGSLTSGKMPVVFDPRVGGGLVGHLLAAMSGPAVARKASFLIGHEDDDLFAPEIRILEDPLQRRGLRSRPFDGEGLACSPRSLVENGRIFGWMTNSASARQLDRALTGHAARGGGGAPGVSPSNVYLAAGDTSAQALRADIADGLYVTHLFGQGVNLVTGDYSRGASGFRIVDGEIAGPVAEITVAGNLLAMFRALTPADDLERVRALDVPTIRVDGMTVAGS